MSDASAFDVDKHWERLADWAWADHREGKLDHPGPGQQKRLLAQVDRDLGPFGAGEWASAAAYFEAENFHALVAPARARAEAAGWPPGEPGAAPKVEPRPAPPPVEPRYITERFETFGIWVMVFVGVAAVRLFLYGAQGTVWSAIVAVAGVAAIGASGWLAFEQSARSWWTTLGLVGANLAVSAALLATYQDVEAGMAILFDGMSLIVLGWLVRVRGWPWP